MSRMLLNCAVALLGLTVVGDPGAAPAPAPSSASPRVAVVLPPRSYSPSDEALAEVMQDRATGLLDVDGRYAVLHLKQIRRMTEGEGIGTAGLDEPRWAWTAATHLGADRIVASTLIRTAGGWSLTFAASSSPGQLPKPQVVALPDDWAQAVTLGGAALARSVADLDGILLVPGALPDFTRSSAAMQAYAECFQVLVRQPMGIENPNVLLRDELQTAVNRCGDAVQSDPDFPEARAALALALAIQGEDAAATGHLKGLSQRRVYLPFGWIAWFWLRTRNESGPAGTEVLRKAVAHDPALLLFRAYLAEQLNALHQQRDALEAWQDYERVCPRSPFGLTRIGYTLARMADHPGAEAATRKALELDPDSRVVMLELATRQIDAGRLQEARATLTQMTRSGNAGAEAYLRLGFTELRLGDLDAADADLRQAVSLAQPASAWRTRARAHLDLARVADAQGRHDAAVQELSLAYREGYRSPLLEPEDPLVRKLSSEAQRKQPSLDLRQRPPEASPFPLDSSGDIRPIPTPQAGIPIIEF
jgi:tetratricopeptide (TPR) repeat protein